MAFEKLTLQDQEIIRQAMHAMLYGLWIEDWEFHLRLGLDRMELRDILATWPQLEDDDDNNNVTLAINNCLNEFLHGVFVSVSDWNKWFKIPKEDMDQAYLRWARLKGYTETGVR